jgi:hypothetical protein
MKQCTDCGKNYPDEATECAIDRRPLESIESKPAWTNKLVGEESEPFPIKKLALDVQEKDNGLWLVWKCPRCLKEANFNAIVTRGNIKVLGIKIGSPTQLFDLRCQLCKYELRVPQSDREQLEKVRELTRNLLEAKITREEYEERVLQMPAKFAKELASLTQHWICSKCGEENPMNFDTCWSCASRTNDTESTISKDAKPFPGMSLGANPWEQ